MAETIFRQIVANKLEDAYGSNAFTHRSAIVTKTATMRNGSLLVAANTEAAAAAAANVTGIIDDPRVDFLATGETLLVSIVEANAMVRQANCTFSDKALEAEGLTALVAAGIKLV